MCLSQAYVPDGIMAHGDAMLSHPPGCEDLAWISLANSQTDDSLSIADSSMPPICERKGGGGRGEGQQEDGKRIISALGTFFNGKCRTPKSGTGLPSHHSLLKLLETAGSRMRE